MPRGERRIGEASEYLEMLCLLRVLKQTNILRRLTSWLFTKRGGVDH